MPMPPAFQKIIGVPLSLIQLSQSIIIRIEVASYLKVFAKQYNPCDVNQIPLSEVDPIQVAYVIDHVFVSKHFQFAVGYAWLRLSILTDHRTRQ
jgi:hypothetical protein